MVLHAPACSRRTAPAIRPAFTPVIGRDFPDRCHYPSLAYTEGVSVMIAVVETEEFLADVKGVLSEDEHDDLISCMLPCILKRVT
jgi:hypothetical protein